MRYGFWLRSIALRLTRSTDSLSHFPKDDYAYADALAGHSAQKGHDRRVRLWFGALAGSFAGRHLSPFDKRDINNGFRILLSKHDEDPPRRTDGGEIAVRDLNGLATG